MENIFYAIEICVDGFGADTLVERIFKTRKEAENYVSKEFPNNKKLLKNREYGAVKIVECTFGKEIEQYFN